MGWSFLKSRPAQLATMLLVFQAALARWVSWKEVLPPPPDFNRIPFVIGDWRAVEEKALEPEVVNLLQPDAYLNRDYRRGTSGPLVDLFVGYFRSLERSTGPHSPKVCLPGAGWLPVSEQVIRLDAGPGREPMPVNQYLLERERARLLVLYWYQNAQRVWADEFVSKLYLLPDLLRYRRSDVALVRITTPAAGSDWTSAREAASQFGRAAFPSLREVLR